MAKVSFFGVPGAMHRHPLALRNPNSAIGFFGQPAKFIGYRHDPKTAEKWVICEEPDSFEMSDAQVASLKRELARDPTLRAADKATATLFGLQFFEFPSTPKGDE